ncbi:MAG: ABC transporter ATP-binding protein [Planctomycetota bacterium]
MPDTATHTRISIEHIAKAFPTPGGGETRAVDDISLTIEPGELFFLLGPSGCGKTTLLRMIAGFIDPTGGLIRFNDRDVTHDAPNTRQTGMVFQSYALWPHMTVAQNVAFGLQVRKVDKQEQARRVQEALEAVQMGEYGHRKPNQLSGGQQQRVALARALVIRPDVLLLDEPLSNLDAKLRTDLRSEIRRICKESGLTTVYVTHDQKEALSMADRVAILRDGKTVQVGRPDELYQNPNTRFVAEFLGETNLLEGEVLSTDGDHVRVRTAAGELNAASRESTPITTGDRVLCSIRPEAARLVEAKPDSPALRYDHTVYLGEIAQHIARAGEMPFKVAEMNPRGLPGRASPGDRFGLDVEPRDIVLLPV